MCIRDSDTTALNQPARAAIALDNDAAAGRWSDGRLPLRTPVSYTHLTLPTSDLV